jgi:hypothetical protein
VKRTQSKHEAAVEAITARFQESIQAQSAQLRAELTEQSTAVTRLIHTSNAQETTQRTGDMTKRGWKGTRVPLAEDERNIYG